MSSNSAHLRLTPLPAAGKPAHQISDQRSYRTGQTVWVRGLKDILKTLDDDGKLDGLPFMPEMLPYCGRPFRVACLPNRTCVEGAGICEFTDVVFLDGLRCDGSAHDGCQRRCLLFWREAWLSDEPPEGARHDPSGAAAAVAGLKTKQGERYFCQSTELAGASTAVQEKSLGFRKRLGDDLDDVRLGNVRPMEFSWHLSRTILNRVKNLAGIHTGEEVVGRLHKTKAVSLGLQTGELVEIRSRKEIEETLDVAGKNKGLLFAPPMLRYCGKRFYVADRLQKMILEETGKMIQLKDTVVLDGVTCQAWGCQRSNLQFWREIWLKRVEPDPR
ncbi:MAG TPA: hypothetical protein VH327_08310 [Gammaproteobacteria bacterium]|jgi:hypothetical protein|nr:hypothetical protein [Gammaproteobacteria bacterium]